MAEGRCVVWWARLSDHRPDHDVVLSAAEVLRSERLLRPADQGRQRLGAALLRYAASELTGEAPAAVTVDRTCDRCGKAHGRPVLPGLRLHASVTHSGDLVGVALTPTGPVGLDVEQVAPLDVEGLSRTVLHDAERAPDLDGFFTIWARKEAVVKATGEGLQAPLPEVLVTAPHARPALLAYRGRALQAHLVDLRPDPRYRAAVAVLSDRPVPVEERLFADGQPKLTSS
jgi:4'-phosphopantetheinyl transferase